MTPQERDLLLAVATELVFQMGGNTHPKHVRALLGKIEAVRAEATTKEALE